MSSSIKFCRFGTGMVILMKCVIADEEKRCLLEQQMTVRMDEYSRRMTALDEGKAEGLEEGKSIGSAEGIEIGRALERDQVIQRLGEQGFAGEQIRELLD